jgi:hypothetical protein
VLPFCRDCANQTNTHDRLQQLPFPTYLNQTSFSEWLHFALDIFLDIIKAARTISTQFITFDILNQPVEITLPFQRNRFAQDILCEDVHCAFKPSNGLRYLFFFSNKSTYS